MKKIFLPILFLALSAMACRMGGLLDAKVPVTPTAAMIPVTTEAVEAAATQVAGAVATAQAGGPIVLEITDAQATSAAALALQEYGENRISNLQIRFLQGQMQVSGDVSEQGFNLPLLVTVSIQLDAQGRPRSQVVDASIGPLPVPQAMLDQLTTQLDAMVLAQFSGDADRIKLESLSLQPGKMTIVARLQ